MQSITLGEFDKLLMWGCLSAAETRGDAFCIQQHRHALLESGESESRLNQIQLCRHLDFFSDLERTSIALGAAISRQPLTSEVEVVLNDATQHFNREEIQRLSTSFLAVNEWIDFRGKDPVRVLVVEDNLDDQELLSHQLKKHSLGNHVLFLSDPRIALHLIEGEGSEDFRKHLVAIMLDLNLPHMSGIALLRVIRSLEQWKDIPVVIMTTNPRPDHVADAKELEVFAFVEKPLTIASFASAVAPLFHKPVMKPDDLRVLAPA